MASIYKRGRVWWVHYLIGGKSVSRSLKTTSERIAYEKKKRLEALETTGQLARPSNIPIEPFLQSFCEFLVRTRTRKSAKNDISYLRSFFGPCCPALKPGSTVPHKFRQNHHVVTTVPDKLWKRHVPVKNLEVISTEMISEFIRERIVEDDIAPKTANRIREVLHRMFSYAIEHHSYICQDQRYRNPVQGVKRATESAPIIRWLTQEQIEHQLFIPEKQPTLRAIVATYIYAGLRREEALWLTVNDVDLERKLIYVHAKEINGEFWQPKTKRNRVVPISSALLKILSGYSPKRECPWYFPSTQGKRWDPDNFSQDLREINREHNLEWSCLDFRHTFGSHLAQKGESLYKIAELMGNSPEICRRHYAALIPEKMHDTVEFEANKAPAVNSNTEDMLRQILEKLASHEPKEIKPKLRIVPA